MDATPEANSLVIAGRMPAGHTLLVSRGSIGAWEGKRERPDGDGRRPSTSAAVASSDGKPIASRCVLVLLLQFGGHHPPRRTCARKR